MDWSAKNEYLDKDWEETCDYCGCVFRIRASNSPRVTLISKRTDGKTDLYKNPVKD